MLNFLPALLLFLIHGSSELGGVQGTLALEQNGFARASLGRSLPSTPAALHQLHTLIQCVLKPVESVSVPELEHAPRPAITLGPEEVPTGPTLRSDRTRDGPRA